MACLGEAIEGDLCKSYILANLVDRAEGVGNKIGGTAGAKNKS